MKTSLAIPLVLSSFMSSPSLGVDFQKGLVAFQIGDFATALREWTPLAEQENGGAQFNLTISYRTGTGFIKDSLYAHL